MKMRSWLPILLLASIPVSCTAQIRVMMSAVESKTGKPIQDLRASEIVITDEKVARAVTELTRPKGTVDVMLLLDTGLAGSLVQPLAYDLIDQIAEPEAMAVVSFDDSAQLLQDFTSSRSMLKESISKARYGNQPRVLDALAAAIGDGFDHSTYRRVLLLLTAGYEGRSVTPEREVVELAHKRGVSIFPIFITRERHGMFESLARQTGGATFNLVNMAKDASQKPAPRIFEVVRNPYRATVSGTARLSESTKIEAKRSGKIVLSALPVE